MNTPRNLASGALRAECELAGTPKSMIELLRAAAEEAPHRIALARAAGVVTYGELVTRAETIAAALRARGVQRLAVLDPDHATVWALLAACSLTGVESCLYPVAATDETVAELRERLGHELLVTAARPARRRAAPPGDSVGRVGGDAGPVPDGPRPLLVLTSGTTSGDPRPPATTGPAPARDPRIQPHAEAALAARLRAQPVRRAADPAARRSRPAPRSSRRHVVPAARRARGDARVRGDPRQRHADVLAVPARRAARRRRARRPALEQITLGGEAVPAAVVAASCRKRFPGAHISQLYAATEFGLAPASATATSGCPSTCWSAATTPTSQLKIVDGELRVRSRSAMLGYYGDEPVDRRRLARHG